MIQVHVKSLSGKTFTLEVARGNLITELKIQISSREGIPPQEQRLIFSEKELEDERKLEDYNIQNGSTIYLALRLRAPSREEHMTVLRKTIDDNEAKLSYLMKDSEDALIENRQLVDSVQRKISSMEEDRSRLLEARSTSGLASGLSGGLASGLSGWMGSGLSSVLASGDSSRSDQVAQLDEKIMSLRTELSQMQSSHESLSRHYSSMIDSVKSDITSLQDQLTLRVAELDQPPPPPDPTFSVSRLVRISSNSNVLTLTDLNPSLTCRELGFMISSRLSIPPLYLDLDYNGTEITYNSTPLASILSDVNHPIDASASTPFFSDPALLTPFPADFEESLLALPRIERHQALTCAQFLRQKGTPVNTLADVTPASSPNDTLLCLSLLIRHLLDVGIGVVIGADGSEAIMHRYATPLDDMIRSRTASFATVHLITDRSTVMVPQYSWKLNMEYSLVPEGSPERAALITQFESEVSTLFSIPQECVKVVGLRSGSVIVDWVIISDDAQVTVGQVDAMLRTGPTQMYTGRTPLLAERLAITPQTCEYRYVPLFQRFQLSAQEFEARWNRDYAVPANVPRGERRGSRPFEAPVGWFRHAISCIRFGIADLKWFGMRNVPGEWPVAYHGVRTPNAQVGGVLVGPVIVRGGLIPGPADAYRAEATRMNPALRDTRGIYCSPTMAVASGYTVPIQVRTNGGVLNYSMIFMCRVDPALFTEHVNGTYWRVHNPAGIRHYGMLIRLAVN